jgi:hypothetical protein
LDPVAWREAWTPDGTGAVERLEALARLTTVMGATRAGIADELRVCASAAKQARNIATTAKAKWTFLLILPPYLTRCPKHPSGCSVLRAHGRKSKVLGERPACIDFPCFTRFAGYVITIGP